MKLLVLSILMVIGFSAVPGLASQTAELRPQCWAYNGGVFFDYTNLQFCQNVAQTLNASSNASVLVEAECVPLKDIVCNGIKTKWAAVLKTKVTVP